MSRRRRRQRSQGGGRVALSKRLTKILRHSAVKEGLPIRPDGFVPLAAVLRCRGQLRRMTGTSGRCPSERCITVNPKST